MKVFIDTNVIIDFLEKRANAEYAKELLKLSEDESQYECISSASVTDMLYIVTKTMLAQNKLQPDDVRLTNADVKASARNRLEKLLSLFHILSVTETSIRKAFALKWKDTEDALQYVVAKENGAECIITNNKSDFETTDIKLMTAQEFLSSLPRSEN